MSTQNNSASPSAIPGIEIGLAREADIAGIHRLMTANLAANGGTLWCETPQGDGARFVFTLPVSEAAP